MTPYLVPMHGMAPPLQQRVANVGPALQQVPATAQQSAHLDGWAACCATSAIESHTSPGRKGRRQCGRRRGTCRILGHSFCECFRRLDM
jgi:hypothetical protein